MALSSWNLQPPIDQRPAGHEGDEVINFSPDVSWHCRSIGPDARLPQGFCTGKTREGAEVDGNDGGIYGVIWGDIGG